MLAALTLIDRVGPASAAVVFEVAPATHRLQRDPTGRNISIFAIRENTHVSEGSAAAKLIRRPMLAQGTYHVDSASERMRMGQDRARADGKQIERPPALPSEQVG